MSATGRHAIVFVHRGLKYPVDAENACGGSNLVASVRENTGVDASCTAIPIDDCFTSTTVELYLSIIDLRPESRHRMYVDGRDELDADNLRWSVVDREFASDLVEFGEFMDSADDVWHVIDNIIVRILSLNLEEGTYRHARLFDHLCDVARMERLPLMRDALVQEFTRNVADLSLHRDFRKVFRVLPRDVLFDAVMTLAHLPRAAYYDPPPLKEPAVELYRFKEAEQHELACARFFKNFGIFRHLRCQHEVVMRCWTPETDGPDFYVGSMHGRYVAVTIDATEREFVALNSHTNAWQRTELIGDRMLVTLRWKQGEEELDGALSFVARADGVGSYCHELSDALAGKIMEHDAVYVTLVGEYYTAIRSDDRCMVSYRNEPNLVPTV